MSDYNKRPNTRQAARDPYLFSKVGINLQEIRISEVCPIHASGYEVRYLFDPKKYEGVIKMYTTDASQLFPRQAVLLISDSEERLRPLRSVIRTQQCDVATALSPEELCDACLNKHDMVIMDVGPNQIESMLNLVRCSEKLNKVPVLVAADRFDNEKYPAGLLPTYRAMACTRNELLALVKERLGH